MEAAEQQQQHWAAAAAQQKEKKEMEKECSHVVRRLYQVEMSKEQRVGGRGQGRVLGFSWVYGASITVK